MTLKYRIEKSFGQTRRYFVDPEVQRAFEKLTKIPHKILTDEVLELLEIMGVRCEEIKEE